MNFEVKFEYAVKINLYRKEKRKFTYIYKSHFAKYRDLIDFIDNKVIPSQTQGVISPHMIQDNTTIGKFVAYLEKDFERFNSFAIYMYSEYKHKVNMYTYKLSELRDATCCALRFRYLRWKLKQLQAEESLLSQFCLINYEAYDNIITHFEKVSDSRISNKLLIKIHSSNFYNPSFIDSLCRRTEVLYNQCTNVIVHANCCPCISRSTYTRIRESSNLNDCSISDFRDDKFAVVL